MQSQLIEIRKMKMQMIQFVSILTLTQIKLMKVTDSSKNMMNKEYKLIGQSKLDVRQSCIRDKSLAAAQCHHPQLFAGRKIDPTGLSESSALIGRNTRSNESRICRKNSSNKK
jgi:hypothetical protein